MQLLTSTSVPLILKHLFGLDSAYVNRHVAPQLRSTISCLSSVIIKFPPPEKVRCGAKSHLRYKKL